MWLRKRYLISRNTNDSKTNKAVLKKMDERNRILCKMRELWVHIEWWENLELLYLYFIPFSSAKPYAATFAERSVYPWGDSLEIKELFDCNISL